MQFVYSIRLGDVTIREVEGALLNSKTAFEEETFIYKIASNILIERTFPSFFFLRKWWCYLPQLGNYAFIPLKTWANGKNLPKSQSFYLCWDLTIKATTLGAFYGEEVCIIVLDAAFGLEGKERILMKL